MSRHKQHRKKASHPEAQPKSSEADTLPRVPRRYPWWFKLVACALPILFLLVLELILRLCGAGYPISFLVRTDTPEPAFVDNPRFGWRFFPPAMARAPQPFRVTAQKPKETCRILVLGESAAMGDPDASFGFPRMLGVLLNEPVSPGVEPGAHKRFEVINAAMTAINSHAIVDIARDCRAIKADYWVIFMGNNEVVGPYGAGTVFGPKAPARWLVRASLRAKGTKLVQVFSSAVQGLKKHQDLGWGGMEMFLRQQCSATDPALQRTYTNFRHNLADILALAENCGANVLLCTVPVNLKDCAPFASLHGKGLQRSKLAEWDNLYQHGTRQQEAGQYEFAAQIYTQVALLDDQYADLHFRLGQCDIAQAKASAAAKHFQKARDLDTLRFRADSRINQIIRETASAHSNSLVLLDLEQHLADLSPDALPGCNFFYEHVHLNPFGNYVVARTIAGQISGGANRPGESVLSRTNWLSDEQVFARLCLTDWNRLQTARLMLQRLERPPYTQRLNQAEELRFLSAEAEQLKSALTPPGIRQAAAQYQSAATARMNDWILLRNYARFLEETGDSDGSLVQWQRVISLCPNNPEAHAQLGALFAEKGRATEAEAELHRALELNPFSPAAFSALGVSHLKSKRLPYAMSALKKALRLDPTYVNAYIYLADVYLALDQQPEAREQLKIALSIQPDHPVANQKLNRLLNNPDELAKAVEFWAQEISKRPESPTAHCNLGTALAGSGRMVEAISSFNKALELNPNFADAHLSLGRALMQLRKPDQALPHFAETVRLKPNDFQAQYHHGWALSELRRPAEARDAFSRAVQLRPEDKDARINLGVTFMRLNDPDAAIAEFKEVVRRYPNDPLAARYLQEIQSQQR